MLKFLNIFLIFFAFVSVGIASQPINALPRIGEVIDEIIILKQGENIPDAILKENSNLDISKSIVVHFGLQKSKELFMQQRFPLIFLEGSELHLFLSQKDIEAVVNKTWNPKSVSGDVTKFMSLKIPKSIELPVSAVLVPRRVLGSNMMDLSKFHGIVAVLASELMGRATWSAAPLHGDSNVDLMSFAYLPNRKEFWKLQSEYYEAQVWGGVHVEDIQEWRVPHNLDKKILELLKKTGLPIYLKKIGNEIERRGRGLVEQGELIWNPCAQNLEDEEVENGFDE